MKRLLSVLLIVAMLICTMISCKNETKESGSLCDQFYDETDVITNLVRMNITYLDANGKKQTGDIVVELNPTAAPITVKNFQTLVSEDFYDGLIFHRVIEGFMIQGGGFTESNSHKESASIKGEFSANGVKNDLKHTRGVISMARTNDMNSASSQFFICQEDYDYGNGNYAAFGKVVKGIKVVDAIAAVATNYNDKPLSNVVIESIKFVTYEG